MHSSVSHSSSLRLQWQIVVYEYLVYLDVDPYIGYEQEDLVTLIDHDEYDLSLFYLIMQLEWRIWHVEYFLWNKFQIK